MNPRQFLMIAGIILLVLAALGFLLPNGMILGNTWYLTVGENLAHLVVGVLAIVSAFWTNEKIQKSLTQAVAIITLFFAVYGFLVANSPSPNTFGVANLENPYDNLLHLIVAVWAGYVGFFARGEKDATSGV